MDPDIAALPKILQYYTDRVGDHNHADMKLPVAIALPAVAIISGVLWVVIWKLLTIVL